MSQKIYRFNDPVNNDFAGTNIKTRPLPESYRYIHQDPLWLAAEFILYRMIAQPVATLWVKIGYSQRFVNKKALDAVKDRGGYLYINHTNKLLDAYCPQMLRYDRRTYIVVGVDALSIPGIENIVEMLGAIPVGSTIPQKEEMRECVFRRAAGGGMIAVYPEAHIWPFYTSIRPLPESSFEFPARDGLPSFAVTNCYQKRRFGSFPKVTTYIDGPFYPDKALSERENRRLLRDMCEKAMRKRAAQYSTYQYVSYIQNNESYKNIKEG